MAKAQGAGVKNANPHLPHENENRTRVLALDWVSTAILCVCDMSYGGNRTEGANQLLYRKRSIKDRLLPSRWDANQPALGLSNRLVARVYGT